MITHSVVSGSHALPWGSGRTFRLWRYGVGHSQLLLRSPGEHDQETIAILFEATEFMRLRRTYPDLTLRLAHDDEGAEFEEIRTLPVPLIHVVLASSNSVGFVACSRVTVRSVASSEGDSWHDGTVLFSVTRGSDSG
jgi:hypothetical protein